MQLTRRRVTHIHSLAARKAVLSSGSASYSVSREPTGFNGHPIGDLGKSRRPNAWRVWKSCDRMPGINSLLQEPAVGAHPACCLAIDAGQRCLICQRYWQNRARHAALRSRDGASRLGGRPVQESSSLGRGHSSAQSQFLLRIRFDRVASQ
jgi:hypothetical protein